MPITLTATAAEMQDNFREYLGAVIEGAEITVTQDGRSIGRFIPDDSAISHAYDIDPEIEAKMDGLPKSVNADKMTPAELRQCLEDGYHEAMSGQGRPLEEFEAEFRKKYGL